ncbi:hypothetical protein KAR48_16490 [bacterium]|nr:hypothetical protein [bacterium]
MNMHPFFLKDEVNVWGAIILSAGFEPSDQGVLISLDADGRMEDILGRLESLGGRIVRGKSRINDDAEGYFAIIKDTEGNRIGLHSKD